MSLFTLPPLPPENSYDWCETDEDYRIQRMVNQRMIRAHLDALLPIYAGVGVVLCALALAFGVWAR